MRIFHLGIFGDEREYIMEVVLELENVTKTFPGVRALDQISFSLKKHDVLGIVGENGAGKSTLFKIISGVLAQDVGSVKLNGKKYHSHNYNEATKFGIFQIFQNSALIQTMPVYENILIGYEKMFSYFGIQNKREMILLVQKKLNEYDLKVDPKSMILELDISTQKMIEIIRALTIFDFVRADNLILLFDEPTSFLKKDDVDRLFDIIEKIKKRASIMFISHRLKEIITLCETYLVLKDGKLIDQGLVENITESKLQESMVGRKQSKDYYKIKQQKESTDSELLSVENISSHNSFSEISFKLNRGEILGLGGLLGSGKEELGKALFGAKNIDSGTVHLKGKRIKNFKTHWLTKGKIGFVSGDRYNEGIFPYLSVRYNLTSASILDLSKFFIVDIKKEQALSDEFIKSFNIKTTSQEALISNLSGGNQQKIILARWVMAKSEILILVNPTQGVDVGAKEEIYQFIRELAKLGNAIILISDDLPELIYLSNRILLMKEGKLAKELVSPATKKPEEVEVIKYIS